MASFKELSLSRPLPHSHNSRHHSHSISLGAVNPNHRITRRKSVTTTTAAANAVAAAVAASVKDPSGEPAAVPMPANRRGSGRRPLVESSSVGTPSGLTPPSYFSRSLNDPGINHNPSSGATNFSSAPNAAGPSPAPDAAAATASAPGTASTTKNRNRRASEGSPLVRSEGKRAMAELRCDRCGKGYKHGSCLSKHMWEHDPAWAVTSKLLISKHQQVQLLEAASVLVNMNHDGPEAESELSSASPDASSERQEGPSSADTTPPPTGPEDEEDEEEEEDDLEMSGVSTVGDKRYDVPNSNSNNPSGLFSHPYQYAPSSSFTGSAPLHSPSFSNFRHSSIDTTRPSTANTKLHDDDEADLAAAIGLCNFGTPRTGPVPLSPSIPPVPALPGRYLEPNGGNGGQTSQSLDQSRVPGADAALPGSIPNMFLSVSYNPSLSYKVSDEREVGRGNAERTSRQNRNADVDFGSRHAPADEDDDGVFGRMEE